MYGRHLQYFPPAFLCGLAIILVNDHLYDEDSSININSTGTSTLAYQWYTQILNHLLTTSNIMALNPNTPSFKSLTSSTINFSKPSTIHDVKSSHISWQNPASTSATSLQNSTLKCDMNTSILLVDLPPTSTIQLK